MRCLGQQISYLILTVKLMLYLVRLRYQITDQNMILRLILITNTISADLKLMASNKCLHCFNIRTTSLKMNVLAILVLSSKSLLSTL